MNSRDQLNLNEFIERLNTNLRQKWQSTVRDQQNIQEKERRSKEYFRQMEEEAEDEIEQLKQTYEKQLIDFKEYTHELTAKVR